MRSRTFATGGRSAPVRARRGAAAPRARAGGGSLGDVRLAIDVIRRTGGGISGSMSPRALRCRSAASTSALSASTIISSTNAAA